MDKSERDLLRTLIPHVGFALYRSLMWKEYDNTCVSAQSSSDPQKKLALLSKAEGIRVALDLWKGLVTKDENVVEELEEAS